MECLVDGARQLCGVFDQPVVFGAGAGDANGIGLLECVRANHKGRNLTRKDNNRDRVHQRIGQTGHRVGRTRTRGHEGDANFASRTCIPFGGVDRSLFMADQNVSDVALLENFVIDR